MSLVVEVRTSSLAMLRFSCPHCGRPQFKYHPSLRGLIEVRCKSCSWQDEVYFNCTVEDIHAALPHQATPDSAPGR